MAINEELTAIEAQHGVYIQRLAAQYGNESKPFIDSMSERISARINREVGKNLTPNRREKLLSDIADIVTEELKGYTDSLKANNADLGSYEADFQAKTLSSLYQATEAASVSKSVIRTNANNTLIKLGDDSYTSYTQMLNNYVRQNAEQIDNIVAQGFVSGTTTREIAAQVMSEVDNRVVKTSKQAKAIARTGTNHYANIARETYFAEEPIVIGTRRIATLDSQTSQYCRGIDNTVVLKTDPNYRKAFAPFHPNAIVKGSLISTGRGLVPIESVVVGDTALTHTGKYMPVTTVMCKRNDTKTLRLTLSNGACISLTDDHPVLLHGLGWKDAGNVNVGDNLFYHTEELEEIDVLGLGSMVEDVVISDSHSIVTKTSEELVSYNIFSTATGVSSSINLNDSVTNQEVSNVLIDGDLAFKFNSAVTKRVEDNLLVSCEVGCVSGRDSLSSFEFDIPIVNGVVCLHSFARSFAALIMKFRVKFTPMLITRWVRGEFHTIVDGLQSSLGVNAEFDGSLSDSVIREVIFSLNKSEALTETEMLIVNELNNSFVADFLHEPPLFYSLSVVSIDTITCDDFVYNISVAEDETYFANGILVHNCRTANIPEVDSRYKHEDDGGERPENFRDAESGLLEPSTTSSKKTYYEAMKSLDAASQDAIMGPTLGRAFRKGIKEGSIAPDSFAKMTIDEKNLKPLTLTEMQKKDNELGRLIRSVKQ